MPRKQPSSYLPRILVGVQVRVFVIRQIGILRDDDKDMDHFSAYSYSPSTNYIYTSSSAGPDFSGLFSVARDVYQRQVLIADDDDDDEIAYFNVRWKPRNLV